MSLGVGARRVFGRNASTRAIHSQAPVTTVIGDGRHSIPSQISLLVRSHDVAWISTTTTHPAQIHALYRNPHPTHSLKFSGNRR